MEPINIATLDITTTEDGQVVIDLGSAILTLSAEDAQDVGIALIEHGAQAARAQDMLQNAELRTVPEYCSEDGYDDDEDYSCPGCGCLPGEGRTPGCTDPDGCGYIH